MSRNPNDSTSGFFLSRYDSDSPFGEKEERKRFVSKVFSIVGLMLVPPFILALIPHADERIMEFFLNNFLATSLSGMLVFILVVILVAFKCVPKWPYNIIFLILMSLSISLVIGALVSIFDILVPAIAISVTVGVVFLVGLLAKYGPCDITGCGLLLCILGSIVALFGLVTVILAFTYPVPIVHTIYAGVSCLLFTLYLWFDLQLIMGGRNHEIGTDEVTLAATMLFSDIILIFIFLLSLIGGASDG